MPLLSCTVWIVLMVIIAGVLIWALGRFPLDPIVKEIGRVCIIVLYVFAVVSLMLNCLGVWHGGWSPALR